MSIVFADDFNSVATYTANWTAVTVRPDLSDGGCPDLPGDLPGGLIACVATLGNSSIYHNITGDASISVRLQLAIKHESPTPVVDREPLYVFMPGPGLPGFLLATSFRNNGALGLRTNNVASQILSSAGVYPTDGTPFAFQWRVTITGSQAVTYAMDVNNVTVWSGTFDWSVSDPTQSTDGLFTRVQLNPGWTSGPATYRIAIDNIEVDNATTRITWSPCGMSAIDGATPVPVITDVGLVCGSPRITVSGTNWRQRHAIGGGGQTFDPAIYIIGPDATIYIVDVNLTVVSYEDGEYVIEIADDVGAGEWCVLIGNAPYCMETVDNSEAPPPFTDTTEAQYSEPFCAECAEITPTVDCDNNAIVITGTGVGDAEDIVVTGPSGDEVDFSTEVVSADELIITLDDEITAGQYCVTLDEMEAICVSASCIGTTYPICRKCRFPLPFADNVYVFLSRIEFLIQSGVSPNSEITIRLSRDGGYTWPIERTLTAGALGAYDWRVFANRFGKGRNWVCEFIVSDPYFWALLQCYVDIEKGTV